ncbi:MAG TPA: thiolase family protein [Clostridiales bacterium]|nr:thiolase family protein [Clostridiales bacterium]HRT82247.1 thiolase family protein [Oscillospiraceae bacterium]
MKNCRDAVIVAYGRSPIGRATKGTLVNEYPVKLASEVLTGVLEKLPNLPLEEIDDVIVGCSTPEDVQGLNMARIIAIRTGLPDEVCGVTVSRFCASGLQSIAYAANEIMADQADILIAGGVESMSMLPMTALDLTALDPKIFKERASCYLPMGQTAEVLTDMFDIQREDMDKYALASHQKASAAQKAGAFKKEIVPVTYTDREGAIDIFSEDECIKHDASLEEMAKLPAAFRENGSVTAGNSSPMNDGMAFVVMMSAEKAEELGIKPIAKFLGYQVAGVDPVMMGIGPVYAVPKLLDRIGMDLDSFDVIELNEAFAVQTLICIEQLGLDIEKVNPRGGAIALGHPLGATGAILMCKALSYLEDTGGKYGLITMCIGAGMGAAGAIEML